MAYNGTGTFVRLYDWTDDAANGIKIRADRMDAEDDGFATGLSTAITKDGQTATTAAIPFASGINTNTVNERTTASGVTIDSVLLKDGRIDWSKAADVPSATTPDITGITGNYVVITGTTTITGFATASGGITRIVRFAGALTLTHNATSLILPGGANITTAAGDVAVLVSEGSGNWRVVAFHDASLDPTDIATITGTETLTNKTLTSPVINGTVTGTGVGTDTGDLVKLEDVGGSAGLPAVDGSQLTGIDTSSSFAALSHQQASGTAGGSTTATTWTTCPLTGEDYDPDGIATLATNQITLAAGTYVIRGWQCLVAANASWSGKLRFRNVTDSTTAGVGLTAGGSDSGTDPQVAVLPPIRFTIAGSKTFELQYYVSTAQATNGLGVAAGSGENEKYALVEITKES